MALKTDYKNDVLDTSVNTKRKYTMVENKDGTVSFTDKTTYTSQGDVFGAGDINTTNKEVNDLKNEVDTLEFTAEKISYNDSSTSLGASNVQGAIEKLKSLASSLSSNISSLSSRISTNSSNISSLQSSVSSLQSGGVKMRALNYGSAQQCNSNATTYASFDGVLCGSLQAPKSSQVSLSVNGKTLYYAKSAIDASAVHGIATIFIPVTKGSSIWHNGAFALQVVPYA